MDFKDQMIDAIERGYATEYDAYDYVRDRMADAADLARKREKEEGDGDDRTESSETES